MWPGLKPKWTGRGEAEALGGRGAADRQMEGVRLSYCHCVISHWRLCWSGPRSWILIFLKNALTHIHTYVRTLCFVFSPIRAGLVLCGDLIKQMSYFPRLLCHTLNGEINWNHRCPGWNWFCSLSASALGRQNLESVPKSCLKTFLYGFRCCLHFSWQQEERNSAPRRTRKLRSPKKTNYGWNYWVWFARDKHYQGTSVFASIWWIICTGNFTYNMQEWLFHTDFKL